MGLFENYFSLKKATSLLGRSLIVADRHCKEQSTVAMDEMATNDIFYVSFLTDAIHKCKIVAYS